MRTELEVTRKEVVLANLRYYPVPGEYEGWTTGSSQK